LQARSAPVGFFSRPGTVVITLRRDDVSTSPARERPETRLDPTSISPLQIHFDKPKTRRAFQMLQTGKCAHQNLIRTQIATPGESEALSECEIGPPRIRFRIVRLNCRRAAVPATPPLQACRAASR
jgi:hypothetical protein